jgi:predicted ribosome quality control (RQC) complex YloA/Tae2 family protein
LAPPATVLERVAFTSSLNLPALLERPEGEEAGVPTSEGDDAQDQTSEGEEAPALASDDLGYALWRRLQQLDGTRPCLLETEGGPQPYPFTLKGFSHEIFPSLLAAFQALEGGEAEEEVSRESTMDRLEKALHQARGKVRGLEREMERTARPEELRERANLLLARLGEVRRGAGQVVLKGFQGEPVTLELDPSLSPHENAELLFEEAARMERAAQRLPSLLKKAASRIDMLEGLRERLRAGEDLRAQIEQLLSPAGEKKRWQGSGKPPRTPYRRFRSSGGLEIRVGRGPRDNDALTFRHSHPEDIWLHARGASGAHVILRWRRESTPPLKELTEAAILAALHSGARTSQVVPVDWTRRKYVRKPRKAPPGAVRTEQAETLFVQTDPDLIDKLRWSP